MKCDAATRDQIKFMINDLRELNPYLHNTFNRLGMHRESSIAQFGSVFALEIRWTRAETIST